MTSSLLLHRGMNDWRQELQDSCGGAVVSRYIQ